MRSLFVQPAHEKIGVVDSQWIVHQVVPSLGNQVRKYYLFVLFFRWTVTITTLYFLPSPYHHMCASQGQSENGKAPWEGVSLLSEHLSLNSVHRGPAVCHFFSSRRSLTTFPICDPGEGAVQEGMGHVPDEDGGGGEGVLQDDGHHPSKLHACVALDTTMVAAVLGGVTT
jgi:hypothetical protein